MRLFITGLTLIEVFAGLAMTIVLELRGFEAWQIAVAFLSTIAIIFVNIVVCNLICKATKEETEKESDAE